MTSGIAITTFGLLTYGGASLSKPTLSSITRVTTTATLTVVASAVTDVLYARYRLSNGDAAWSAESETFKRVGSGTIVLTGLLEDTYYEYAIYNKSFGSVSDWGFLDNREYDFTDDLTVTIEEEDSLTLTIEDIV